ncbi:MAG: ATP-binding protein [Nitriliruptorales bacterium]|nr:ATP-binding protein [Nitriliruptorales bacterium]
MNTSTSRSRSVSGFALVLAVFGVALATLSLAVLPSRLPLLPAAALTAAAAFGVLVPLRFERNGQTQGFTLEEAVFVAVLFAVSPGAAPVLLVIATLIAHLVLRTPGVKVAFNVGQVGLWTSFASGVFVAVQPPTNEITLHGLLAVLLAVLMANIVSLMALAELFRRLQAQPWLETITQVWRLNVITGIGNTSFGLLLAFVALTDPLFSLLASSLLVGLYLGYRGYAHQLQDRSRTERLHEITQALAAVPSSGDLRHFLQGLCGLFGASRAGVTIADEQTWVGDSEHETVIDASIRRQLSNEMGGPPRRLADGTLMVAPVTYEGEALGAIAVSGRAGVEPWDDADLTLLSTVAHEAGVALKNVELFQQVERERARWEAESTKLGDIVNAATDGIAMLSSDGVIQTWNEAMATITGVPAGQAEGQPWYVPLRIRDNNGEELLPDGDHSLNQAIRGQRYREPIDLQILRRDGKWRVLRATFAPIHREDTHPAGTVMVARDVTAELEVESLKADFVATVSHELRTPLTPLRGFLQTLAANRDKLDEDQVETIYNSMDSQLGRLERLIADLLVVADLDSGAAQLNRDPVDLLEAATVAVAHEASSDTERVVVHGREDVVAIGDAKAVVRIVRSLVSNALKHTDGPVEVLIEQDGDEGNILVIDDGPGIAPWEQKQIFERFRRLGDHLTRNQGPGLGLPIAAALAERLDGKVTVESDVGEGSTFILRLPLSRPRLVETDGVEAADTQVS